MRDLKELKEMLFEFSNNNTDSYILNIRNMFDLKLISYDEHTVLKEFILDNKLENTKTTYYLFGTEAVNSYRKGGILEVLKDVKEYDITFGHFAFIEGGTKSSELLAYASGWMDYAIITKKDFEQL